MILNKCNFIITVVKGTEHSNSSGFFCFSEKKWSGVCNSSTEAINTYYKKVFHSNAKFSSSLVMGFDNSNIIQQLLSDIIFHSYVISLKKLNIFMLEIGKSKKPE